MKNYSSSPDDKLTKAIKASDSEAFKALYFRYHKSLLNFLFYRLNSNELARDFVQEIFTRVWQNRRNLDDTKPMKAYLYRIANNLVIDHSRKKSTTETSFSEADQHNIQTNDSLELKTLIKTAVNNLPEKLKIVFVLSRYEGLKYSEIAEACNISVKAVEKRMSRALNLLQEMIDRFYEYIS